MLRRFAKTSRKDREPGVVDLCGLVAVAVVGEALLDLGVRHWRTSGSRHPAESIKNADFRQLLILTGLTFVIGTCEWADLAGAAPFWAVLDSMSSPA